MNRLGEAESTPKKRNQKMEENVLKDAITKSGRKVKRPAHLDSPERVVSASPVETRKSTAPKASRADAGTPGKRAAVAKETVLPEEVRPSRKTIASARKATTEPMGTPKRAMEKEPKQNVAPVDEGAGVSKSGRKIKVPVKLMEFESEILTSPRKTVILENDEASKVKLTKTPGRPAKTPAKLTASAVEDEAKNRTAPKTPGRRTKSVAPNHPEEEKKDTAPVVRTPRRKTGTALFKNEKEADLQPESPAQGLESQPKTPGKRAAKSVMMGAAVKAMRAESPVTEKVPPKTPGRRTKSVAVDKEAEPVSDTDSKGSHKSAQTPGRRAGRATINVAKPSREESPIPERAAASKGRRVGKSMINVDLLEGSAAEQVSIKTPVRRKRAAAVDSVEDTLEDPERILKTPGQKFAQKDKQQAEESISDTEPVQSEKTATNTLASNGSVSRSGRKIKPKRAFDFEQDEKAAEPSVADEKSLNESGRKRKANDETSAETMTSPSKKKNIGGPSVAAQTPNRNNRLDGIAESSQTENTPDGTVSRSGRKIKPKKMFGYDDSEKETVEHVTGSSPTLVEGNQKPKTVAVGTPSKRVVSVGVSVKSVQKKHTDRNELLDEDQLQTHYITKRGVDDHHHQHHLVDETDSAVFSSDPVILRTSIGFGKPATAKKTPFIESATVKGVSKSTTVKPPTGDCNVSVTKEKLEEANVTVATEEAGDAKVSVGTADVGEANVTVATVDAGDANVAVESKEPMDAKVSLPEKDAGHATDTGDTGDAKVTVEMEEDANTSESVETKEALNRNNSQKENDEKSNVMKDTIDKDLVEPKQDEILTPYVEKEIKHDAEKGSISDQMQIVNNPKKEVVDEEIEDKKQEPENNASEEKLELNVESNKCSEKGEVSTLPVTEAKPETFEEQPSGTEQKALGETGDTRLSSDNISNVVQDAEGSEPATELQMEDVASTVEASLEIQNNGILANKNESFEMEKDLAAGAEVNNISNFDTEKNADDSVPINEPKNTSTSVAEPESEGMTEDGAVTGSPMAVNDELLENASFGGIEYLEDEVTNIVEHIKKLSSAHAANDSSILEVSVDASSNPAIVITPETPAVTQAMNETYSPVKPNRVSSSPTPLSEGPVIDITADTPRPVVAAAAVAAPRTPKTKPAEQTVKDDCSPDKPPEIIEIMDSPAVASFCHKINSQLVQGGEGGSSTSTPLPVRSPVEAEPDSDEHRMEYQPEGRKRSLSASVAETTLKRNVTFHSPANCTMLVDVIDERLMLKSVQDQQQQQANEGGHGTSIGEKLRKPRKRSLSEHKSSELKRNKVSKLPNFKNIHANHFNRMESIADFMKRKETRAKHILTAASPATKLLARPVTASHDPKTAEASTIEKKETSTLSKPFLFKSTGAGSGIHVPSAGLFSSGTKGALSTAGKASAGSTISSTTKKPIPSDTDKMAKRMKQFQATFKPKQIATDATMAPTNTTTAAEGRPVEQLRSKQTKILKGVRTNRRFELQMKHRDHLQQQ